jgi:glycopeptide antibiotics resistance protein
MIDRIKNMKIKDIVSIDILFKLYIITLIIFVLFKFKGSVYDLFYRMESINENRKLGYWNIDLIPFSATVPYLANISEPYAFRNILGKIIRYVPMGIFFPLVFKNLNRFIFFFWFV